MKTKKEKYLDKIIFDGDMLDIRISAMSWKDWSDWMKDHFHERDVISVPDAQLQGADFFSSVAYQFQEKNDFNRFLKGHYNCIKSAFYSTLGRSKTEWHEKAIDRLFVLAGMFGNLDASYLSSRVDKYIGGFLNRIDPKPDRIFDMDTSSPDIYSSILTAITGLRMKKPYDFWSEQLNVAPDHYAFVCFEGACVNSPYDAINILNEVQWLDENLEKVTVDSIRSFMEYYVDDIDVLKALAEQKQYLPHSVQESIDDQFKELAMMVQERNIQKN